MPLLGTRGAASAQGFGEFAQSGPVNYIEDVFSTYLYNGSGTGTQTITNGIDLSGKGGMVWGKVRTNIDNHYIFDTARGAGNTGINSNTTDAQGDSGVTAFNSNGFSVGTNLDSTSSARTFVTWTFRKQPKFFDVVTWTGDGTNNRQISHALGSTPGCIIVKELNQTGSWYVYHTSNGTGKYMRLNATDAVTTAAAYFPAVSSTTFTPTSDTQLNTSTVTYVAYLFAHNAGGFGTSGTDNVISCGSYTGNASTTGPIITLGYEPQFVMVKAASTTGNWTILDNMRALNETGYAYLRANTATAEVTGSTAFFRPLATGFQPLSATDGDTNNPSGTTYIYIAIRRGPMKTPTSGTSVFNAVSRTGTGATATITGPSFPPDFVQVASRSSANGFLFASRLQGNGKQMLPSNTNGEGTNTNAITTIDQNGITVGTGSFVNTSGQTYINYFLGRAPGFMDVVCYTGTGSATTFSHNLGVAPELMIVKNRTTAGTEWGVYAASQGATKFAYLNDTAAFATSSVMWNNTAPTSSVFTVGTVTRVNGSGNSLVAYLFASCPGVSKVSSYTGTGSTQTISCGFAARFVMIKRTDSTGDWYVYDTTRGMVAGTDPYLLYNTTGAEVNQNDVYTNASGFQLVSGNAGTNANGGTYIYLAIA